MGIINYSLKNYENAIILFKKALLINPKNFDALLNIGVTFRNRENEKAIDCFNKCADVNSNKSIIFYNLGSIYEEECDLNKAITFYKAISINNQDYDLFMPCRCANFLYNILRMGLRITN